MDNKSVIEWLQEEYHKRGESLPSGVFQEAKEMHKQEIIDAGNSCAMESKLYADKLSVMDEKELHILVLFHKHHLTYLHHLP